jgi:hypothetical protein
MFDVKICRCLAIHDVRKNFGLELETWIDHSVESVLSEEVVDVD